MDRRKFIKVGAAAAAATAVSAPATLQAAESSIMKSIASSGKAREYSSESGEATKADLLVRFLGTGAADWNGKDERGEQRRLSSALFDGKVLIDYTKTDEDMLPEGFKKPDAVFYTHSHGDHYNAKAELEKIGSRVIYVSETWYERARKEFADAARELGKYGPEVRPLSIGQKIQVAGLTITALPGNHSTSDMKEQTLIYLVEKGAVRVLYATDTGGIPIMAARRIGIDAHIPDGKPITGLIMEATMGMDYDEDFRIFTHSSVGTVLRTAKVLLATKRLVAPAGQPVYLTHMARTLHGTQAELDAQLPEPLRAAYDGLEVIFRAI